MDPAIITDYTRDARYLHPYIALRISNILQAVSAKLPRGFSCKVTSVFRTPEDQFRLYKQGRTFRNGSWIKTGNVVTNIDGIVKKSRHNWLPATATDISIFKGKAYVTDAKYYSAVREGTGFGLDWGGNWKSLKDYPHLEIPPRNLFKRNPERDNARVWQLYLAKCNAYKDAVDGYFGPLSQAALKKATKESARNIKAWNILYDKVGPLDISLFPINK